MRPAILLLLLIPLAGCASSPAALGITGPRGSQLVPPAMASQTPETDPMLRSSRYAPDLMPTTNGGRYWGEP